MEAWIPFVDSITAGAVATALRALVILIAGYFIARLVSRSLGQVAERYADAQRAMLARRISFYALLGLVIVSVLWELGFQLGVLLGAAGILTIAIGFASQTSASNLISGLFLIAEQPFIVGDVITVGDTTGEVLSVDLISVKLRTFDNLMVRIPNETLVKSQITNLTRFPIRRLDMQIGVAYKEELKRVREILFDVADKNPLCLEEPKPLFIFLGFGDSALNLQFSVWAKRENFLDLRNSIHEDVKKTFDENGIEIPFPHRTLYAGAVTTPHPIQLTPNEPDTPPTPDAAAETTGPERPTTEPTVPHSDAEPIRNPDS